MVYLSSASASELGAKEMTEETVCFVAQNLLQFAEV